MVRRSTFLEHARGLAWGAWAELGVPGWVRSHKEWVIDPEPLIIFTAWLGDEDARLRDEATDWCIANWRHVSKARLKNLLRDEPAEVEDAFGELSATVSKHAGIEWPARTSPRRHTVGGRTSLPTLERPSLGWLRMRAVFGLGVRAEILRVFLLPEVGRASVGRLMALTGYGKRTVAEECEELADAGVLATRSVRNRLTYSLVREEPLLALLGTIGAHRLDWVSLLAVVRELVDLQEAVQQSPERLVAVKVSNALGSIEDELADLGIEVDEGTRPNGVWPTLERRAGRKLSDWAAGEWRPLVT
jgi:hypothetical protein